MLTVKPGKCKKLLLNRHARIAPLDSIRMQLVSPFVRPALLESTRQQQLRTKSVPTALLGSTLIPLKCQSAQAAWLDGTLALQMEACHVLHVTQGSKLLLYRPYAQTVGLEPMPKTLELQPVLTVLRGSS